MEEKNLIEVENLTKDYGHGRGIFDVSFKIKKGEVFGFLGPNGAGKSTTIRHIMGFSKPQYGQTRILGYESFQNYYRFLGDVGYLPGEIALPEGLTGWEFLKMMGDLRNLQNKERMQMLLEKFQLNPKGETKRMSLGDKRKLAIVAAFMNDPKVLILDEPTSGLDPVMQQVFIDYIKEEKKRGKTILLSSHMFNEVEATCDRIAIIKDGRIVSMFETNNIKHNENKSFQLQFNSKKDFDVFLKILPINKRKKLRADKPCITKFDEEKLTIEVFSNDKYVNELISTIKNFDLTSFIEHKLTLQDYFMQFYREDKKFGGVF